MSEGVERTPHAAGILSLLRRVRLLVCDFDGVMTDNRVLVGEDGCEYVFCSRADGLGIEMLRAAGVSCLIISKETNPVVARRAAKLRLECIQACDDKWAMLDRYLADRGLPAEAVAYVGNDVNDLECLRHVGLPIGVADSHPALRPVVLLTTAARGGQGAVREICDLILSVRSGGTVALSGQGASESP